MPKRIPLHSPAVCAVCGSPEINSEDRVYHRNMNFPRIEWTSYLPVQVCIHHQGTWKLRIWIGFISGIVGLLGGLYLVTFNMYLGYTVIAAGIGIPLFLVYWRDPAARAIRVESYGGFSLIQPKNVEWALHFFHENSKQLREIPDVLGNFRRKKRYLFLICYAAIIGLCISLIIVLPLWHLTAIPSELVKHPEFLGGILSITASGIILCTILTIGLDQMMREKEKAFQGILDSSVPPIELPVKVNL